MIKDIAESIGICSREIDGDIVYHSRGMIGVSLSDLLELEDELREEIANSIYPERKLQKIEVSENDRLRQEEVGLKARISSLARKSGNESPQLDKRIEELKQELFAVQARLPPSSVYSD